MTMKTISMENDKVFSTYTKFGFDFFSLLLVRAIQLNVDYYMFACVCGSLFCFLVHRSIRMIGIQSILSIKKYSHLYQNWWRAKKY